MLIHFNKISNYWVSIVIFWFVLGHTILFNIDGLVTEINISAGTL